MTRVIEVADGGLMPPQLILTAKNWVPLLNRQEFCVRSDRYGTGGSRGGGGGER